MNKKDYLSDADMDAMHDALDQRDNERLTQETHMFNKLPIDRFTIVHTRGQVISIEMPDGESINTAAADCMELMALEIIKMRELLHAVYNSSNPVMHHEARNQIYTYIESIPK